MDIDDIKQRLGGVCYYRQRIDNDLERLQRLRSIAEKMTPTLTHVPAPTMGGGRENAIAALVDLEEEIVEEISATQDLEKEIRFYIDQLDNYQERLVMEMTYINCMKQEAIAQKMHYDVRTISRLHRSAVERIGWMMMSEKMS